jgi:hypothetical protein
MPAQSPLLMPVHPLPAVNMRSYGCVPACCLPVPAPQLAAQLLCAASGHLHTLEPVDAADMHGERDMTSASTTVA